MVHPAGRNVVRIISGETFMMAMTPMVSAVSVRSGELHDLGDDPRLDLPP